mmetsp:Transcript_36724/g.43877  ORF Transcript_36724/g.43877 Transcript_36724/m.43877 type:complete len:199 (+) Transcript_36724:65-661(+)
MLSSLSDSMTTNMNYYCHTVIGKQDDKVLCVLTTTKDRDGKITSPTSQVTDTWSYVDNLLNTSSATTNTPPYNSNRKTINQEKDNSTSSHTEYSQIKQQTITSNLQLKLYPSSVYDTNISENTSTIKIDVTSEPIVPTATNRGYIRLKDNTHTRLTIPMNHVNDHYVNQSVIKDANKQTNQKQHPSSHPEHVEIQLDE